MNAVDPEGLIQATVGGGIGGGFHYFGAGINIHSHIQCGSGGCYEITTICGRIGPGVFLGGGLEGGGSVGSGSADNNQECDKKPCTKTWSVGVGGDIAFGNKGGGAAVGAGSGGVAASGGIKSPLSLGIGFSFGIDICITRSCPLF